MYRVQLKNFEGPLDLLLFFIKRDELDIYDIPISYITEQFLEYIHLMEELDLDVASEFILMASMLMSIKARMMIPRSEEEGEGDEEHDPRYELVQRLLEYKRYKETGIKMRSLAGEARKQHRRGTNKADRAAKQPQQLSGEALRDVTMFDLMKAFRKVLMDIKKRDTVHHVERIEVTIEQQTVFIQKRLQQKGRSSFAQICNSLNNRIKVIVTFLAMLEMLKEQKLSLYIEEGETMRFYVGLTGIEEVMETEGKSAIQ
jgi:segregation and condensation protein A